MEPTELEQHQKKCIELCLQFHDLELHRMDLIAEISNIKKWIAAELVKEQSKNANCDE